MATLTFADVAAGHTVSRYGHTEHSIAVGNPFTGDDRGIYFDASGDYVTVDDSDDLTLSTDDWTIEGWFKWDGATSQQWSLAQKSWAGSSYGTGSDWSIYYYSGYLRFYGSYYAYDGNNRYFNRSFTPTLGKWHHVAVVQNSGSTQLYVDGKELGTAQNTSGWSWNNSTGDLTLNRWQGASDSSYSRPDRAVYDFRIVKGTAVYTGEFTPPSGKLTATGGEYPDTTNVNTSITSSHTVLHLQPVKTDSSLHDETSNHTVSKTSGTSYDKASTPYEAAAKSTAMYFDGTGDYLQTSTSSDLTFGTGDFTLETWLYPTTVNTSAGYKGIISDELYSSTGGWAVSQRDDELSLWVKDTGGSWVSFVADGALTANQWQHIAVSYDSSTTTTRLFVDGTSVASGTTSGWNLTGDQIEIGRSVSGQEVAGYLFDVRATKGTARYTSNFTAPSAAFELNPVYLGGDQSGNKNHFTVSGISFTHDVLLDTPTKNYCLINPLAETKTDSTSYDANPTTGLSEGNLKLTSSALFFNGHGTLGVSSGKWYFEWYSTGDWTQGGFTTHEMFSNYSQSLTDFWTLYNRDSSNNIAVQYKDGTGSANAGWAGGGHASGNGNVYGCAFDVDNRKMYFHKNGEWSDGTSTLTSTFPSSYGGDLTGSSHNIPADTTFFPTVRPWTSSTVIANFGQDSTFANTVTSGSANAADTNGNGDFRYTPPSGYLALCTANLDAPTVTPSENFEALTYSGSGSSRSITGLDFEPSLVWLKDRTTGGSSGFHCIHDSVRGDDGTHKYILSSDNTITTDTTYSGYGVTSFNSDGFSIINGGSLSNDSSRNYVAWNWKAHQSPASSSTRTTYTVKVEDSSDDAWDDGSYYDSNYLPSPYMEIFENRNGTLVSLGEVAVRTYDSSGDYMSDVGEQNYTLECADLDAIAVKWHYDTSADGDEYDYPNSYNGYLNEQAITILDGSTSEWGTNNYSNDDGSSYNYSPPTGWADGDTLKSATTSYNGSDTATLTSGSGPVEKYNAAAGFSIISYTGNKDASGSEDGETQEITHSLGAEPELIITKSRGSGSYDSGYWEVYHKHTVMHSSHTDNSIHPQLWLNNAWDSYQGYYSPVIPKSGSENTIIEVTNDSGYGHYANESQLEYIMYAWTPVEGYSKFGSFAGNGSSDGPMVYTGFRPKYLMIKNTTSSNQYGWFILDSAREPDNDMSDYLYANTSDDEDTAASNKVDFLSSGFKMRGSGNVTNQNNGTMVYIAFAESPFKYANAK